VLQVQTEHGGDGPRGLSEIDEAVQGQGGEELARELLVIERGEAEGGPICPRDAELRQDRGVALRHFGPRRHEEGSQAEALAHLELGGDGRDRETARGVRVAQAHDVEQELLLGGGLDHLVVLETALLERRRAEARAASHECTEDKAGEGRRASEGGERLGGEGSPPIGGPSGGGEGGGVGCRPPRRQRGRDAGKLAGASGPTRTAVPSPWPAYQKVDPRRVAICRYHPSSIILRRSPHGRFAGCSSERGAASTGGRHGSWALGSHHRS